MENAICMAFCVVNNGDDDSQTNSFCGRLNVGNAIPWETACSLGRLSKFLQFVLTPLSVVLVLRIY